MENSFFEDHFRFSYKIGPISMYISPLTHHVFSSFLFYQELRTFKNYRAFRFKVPDKKMISSRRITIFQGRMSISHQKLLLQFFSNMECDCAADNFRSLPICTSFGVFIRLELDVQLYLHFPPPHCPCKNPCPEIKLFIAHIATAGK